MAIPGFNMFTIAAPSHNAASIDCVSFDVARADISSSEDRISDLFPDQKLTTVEILRFLSLKKASNSTYRTWQLKEERDRELFSPVM